MNFRRGWGGVGPGPSHIKTNSENVFLVISLFYRSSMVTFKENYHFFKVPEGANIFQGEGTTFSVCVWGVQMLIPNRNPHYLCFFPGEVRTPWLPLLDPPMSQPLRDSNPPYSVEPTSACQRNAIRMAFRWRADGGPLLHVYWVDTCRTVLRKAILQRCVHNFLVGLVV